MKNLWKTIIVLILAASVAAVLWLKQPPAKEDTAVTIHPIEKIQPKETKTDPDKPLVTTIEAVKPEKLPMLIDLGADKCIPCKLMKPILDELRSEYKGILDVVFIDVWKDPAPGQKYGIKIIPTQIFLDPNGKELSRHQGFLSKEDILDKWKGLGVNLEKGTSNEKN